MSAQPIADEKIYANLCNLKIGALLNRVRNYTEPSPTS
jgi:hypothetical protein